MKGNNISFQCFIKDESVSIAYVVRTGYANQLKLPYSKDMVVNVLGKGHIKRDQVSVKRLNANEPLMNCRKFSLLLKPQVCIQR